MKVSNYRPSYGLQQWEKHIPDMKKLKIRKLAALFTSKQFTQKDNDRHKTNTVIKAPDLG